MTVGPDYLAYRRLTDQLPTWADRLRTFWVVFTREEDGKLEHGYMMTDASDAYHLAEWLVEQKLAHSAWVTGALTPTFRRRPTS